MPFKEGYIEERLGALPSPWMNTHYRLPQVKDELIVEIPLEFIELLQYVKKINDQGNVGSCVGHCGDTVMSLMHNRDGLYEDFSAGWLYWRSRYWANVPEHVEGSTNLGLMKALNKDGATLEAYAETDTVSPFSIHPKPDAETVALNYKALNYYFVNKNPTDMKAAMIGLVEGFPEKTALVSAYPVYESFKEGYDDGVVPLPKPDDKLLGGHSSAIVGWKLIDGKEYWINANSWGTAVGDEGYFYLPIDYPFYDVELIKVEQSPTPPPPPVEPESIICQLLHGLIEYFKCGGDCEE